MQDESFFAPAGGVAVQESEIPDHATSLIRESVFLSIIMGLANLANVIFQILMGRWLTATDYGVLMAMVGILYILNVPADSFRTVMAYFAAREAAGREHSCRMSIGLYRQVMRRLLVLSAAILLVMTLATPYLIGVFHLEGPGPLYAAMLVCVSTLAMTTFQGVLQGTERFGWYGVSMNCWFWGRLLFAAILVCLGFRATGALAGMTLGALAGVIIPRMLLHRALFAGQGIVHSGGLLRPLYRYVSKVTMAYALFMVLANMDVIAVKHWFSPDQAGEFSRGAMLAHLIWLMPFPVVMAMFPKLVTARNLPGVRRRLLIKGIAVSAGTSVLLALILQLFCPYVFHILFRSPSSEMIGHMPVFLGAMLPVSFLFVLMNYDLALNKRVFLFPLALGNVLMAVALYFRHGSIGEILQVLLIGCWLLFAVQVLFFIVRYWRSWRLPANELSYIEEKNASKSTA